MFVALWMCNDVFQERSCSCEDHSLVSTIYSFGQLHNVSPPQ